MGELQIEQREPVTSSEREGVATSPSTDDRIDVSIVMPCLNEAETVGVCVKKAVATLKAHNIRGEVVVADNGSTDDSPAIAAAAGARVIYQPLAGYGNAYMKGFEEARGRYILMADSDDTYDLTDLPRFIEPLRDGYDAVIGNRFSGEILPAAMPWLHRYVGNPILSGLLNLFFKTGIGDAHCGMRAFTRNAYHRMNLQTGGMEFASEMVINAAKAGLKMTEVPITYYPRGGESKLHSFRDGWRHLRFMLLYSPTHLFLLPGASLMAIGLPALILLALGPVEVFSANFGIHWMFVASLLAILGFQVINLGFFARIFSLSSHIDRAEDPIVSYFSRTFRMEHGILAGGLLLILGLANFAMVLVMKLQGDLIILTSTRFSIVALTFSILGAQTIFASFFVSMMVVKRHGWWG